METLLDQIFPDFLVEFDTSQSNDLGLLDIDPSIFDEPFIEEISEFELQQAVGANIKAPVSNDDETSLEDQPAKRFKSLNEKDLKVVDEHRFSSQQKKLPLGIQYLQR